MGKFLPILLLIGSNIFMTYAWYGHLKDLRNAPIFVAIVASWAVAFLEYCLQVPANRIGSQYYGLAELKVMQEVITMAVFAIFSTVYMRQPVNWNYAIAGVCLVVAAFFMFRGIGQGA
ncbi:MAG: DMT family protein [Thermogutta sp.]